MNGTFEMKETNRRKTKKKQFCKHQTTEKSTGEIKIELSSQLTTTFL